MVFERLLANYGEMDITSTINYHSKNAIFYLLSGLNGDAATIKVHNAIVIKKKLAVFLDNKH